MKRQPRSLKLNRETIRPLVAGLDRIAGGMRTDPLASLKCPPPNTGTGGAANSQTCFTLSCTLANGCVPYSNGDC